MTMVKHRLRSKNKKALKSQPVESESIVHWSEKSETARFAEVWGSPALLATLVPFHYFPAFQADRI